MFNYYSHFVMRKVYAFICVGIIVIFTTLFMLDNNNSDCLLDTNVDALAQTEAMQILCDGYSYTIICQKSCLCGRTWITYTGYGHALGLRGTCVCGRTL